MKKRLVILILGLLLFLIVLIVLGIRPLRYQVRGLDAVERIEVLLRIDNESLIQTRAIKTMHSSEKVGRIIEEIHALKRNWQYDGFSPPYTSSLGKPNPIWLVFYDTNDKAQVTLSIGYSDTSPYSLQEIYGPGRYLDYHEFKKLMSLLAIDEEFAYYEK